MFDESDSIVASRANPAPDTSGGNVIAARTGGGAVTEGAADGEAGDAEKACAERVGD